MLKLFDYECTTCKHVFEELVNSDEPNPSCPECGALETNKLISATRINTMCFLSKTEYADKMKKRSADHTTAMLKKDGHQGQRVHDVRKK